MPAIYPHFSKRVKYDECLEENRWIPGNEFTERGGIIMNLKGRHFLTLKDYTPEEIAYLLELSADLKKKKKEGVHDRHADAGKM